MAAPAAPARRTSRDRIDVPQTAKPAAPPPAPLVRNAGTADTPGPAEIEARSFDDGRLPRRSFRHLPTRGHAVSLVIESDGRVAGYAVDRDLRGRGLGAMPLATIERRAAAEGRAFMRFEVRPGNASAIARYRAAGAIGDGLYGIDIKRTAEGVFVIEINDNPNLDRGVEDAVLEDGLYRTVLKKFIRRIEAR